MTFKRNVLIPDLHHKIGVINESRVVHKLLIRHGLFQKCIYESNHREQGENRRNILFKKTGLGFPHSFTSVFSCIDNSSNVFVKGLELVWGQRLCRNEGRLGAVRGHGASVCPGREQVCGKCSLPTHLQKQVTGK